MTLTTLPYLLLAQTADAPPLPGAQTAPAAATTATASGGTADPAGGAPAPASGSAFLIVMMLVAGAMIVFQIVNARRERKKRDELLGGIKKHDRVVTIGGVIGSVVEVKDDEVILKVDETSNTRITFTKSAVSQVVRSAAGEG
jgi:preprotein translocase subunit YajC